MSKKTLREILADKDLLEKFLTVSSLDEAHAFASENGYTGTHDEFKEELKSVKQELILSQDPDAAEMAEVTGGYGPKVECGVSQCHDTYDSDHPCILDDYCAHVLNLYCAGKPMHS